MLNSFSFMTAEPMTMSHPLKKFDEASSVPVSARIRDRIVRAGRRFHANDNISDFIEADEMDALLDEVEAKMHTVLESLVIDTESDHNTQGTARRVAKMYLNEVFRGRYVAEPPVTEFPNAERLNEPTSTQASLDCPSSPGLPNGSWAGLRFRRKRSPRWPTC